MCISFWTSSLLLLIERFLIFFLFLSSFSFFWFVIGRLEKNHNKRQFQTFHFDTLEHVQCAMDNVHEQFMEISIVANQWNSHFGIFGMLQAIHSAQHESLSVTKCLQILAKTTFRCDASIERLDVFNVGKYMSTVHYYWWLCIFGKVRFESSPNLI